MHGSLPARCRANLRGVECDGLGLLPMHGKHCLRWAPAWHPALRVSCLWAQTSSPLLHRQPGVCGCLTTSRTRATPSRKPHPLPRESLGPAALTLKEALRAAMPHTSSCRLRLLMMKGSPGAGTTSSDTPGRSGEGMAAATSCPTTVTTAPTGRKVSVRRRPWARAPLHGTNPAHPWLDRHHCGLCGMWHVGHSPIHHWQQCERAAACSDCGPYATRMQAKQPNLCLRKAMCKLESRLDEALNHVHLCASGGTHVMTWCRDCRGAAPPSRRSV